MEVQKSELIIETLICISVQLDVTIYRFILEMQKLYMFRAFLAHPQEYFCCIVSSWYNKLIHIVIRCTEP
jgi:hypothetical protein